MQEQFYIFYLMRLSLQPCGGGKADILSVVQMAVVKSPNQEVEAKIRSWFPITLLH